VNGGTQSWSHWRHSRRASSEPGWFDELCWQLDTAGDAQTKSRQCEGAGWPVVRRLLLLSKLSNSSSHMWHVVVPESLLRRSTLSAGRTSLSESGGACRAATAVSKILIHQVLIAPLSPRAAALPRRSLPLIVSGLMREGGELPSLLPVRWKLLWPWVAESRSEEVDDTVITHT
jgi:hypothetical protein